MILKIAILSGDGIGPEVILQAKKALYAIGMIYNHEFVFEEALIGEIAQQKTGKSLPKQTLNLCLNTDAILLGTIENLITSNKTPDCLLQLKEALGVYVQKTVVKPYQNLVEISPLKNNIIDKTNFCLFTESNVPSALNMSEKINLIAKLVFEKALEENKKVTFIKTENDDFWEESLLNFSKNYQTVIFETKTIERAIIELNTKAPQFDILVTSQSAAAIVTNQAKSIIGNAALLATMGLGSNKNVFEVLHRACPSIKNTNIANPIGAIMTAVLILEHFGLEKEAQKVKDAIEKVIEYNVLTSDLKIDSKFGTNEMGDFVVNYIMSKDDLLYFNKNNVNIGQSTIV
jgi:3-isopropylmalate dehydrogenase